MAFPAIAALVGAAGSGAAIGAGMVLAAVAEVGLAMTVVGGVTGNQKLMRIGGAMSLIGGVGGMIAGAAGGAASGAAGLGEAATGAALDTASEAAMGAVSQTAIDGVTDSMLTDLGGEAISSAAAPELAAAANQAMPVTQAQTPGPTPVQPASASPTTVNDLADVGARTVDAPAAVQGAAEKSPYETFRGSELMDQKINPTNPPESSGNFFSKFTTWAEKNPKMFSSGLQLAGGAMKGANESAMWNEKMGFEKDKYNRANTVAKFQPRGIIEGARA